MGSNPITRFEQNFKDSYLGKQGTRKAKQTDGDLISRWLAQGCNLPDPEQGLTIKNLILVYVTCAQIYYAGGERSTAPSCIKAAMSIRMALLGRYFVPKSTPSRLKSEPIHKCHQSGYTQSTGIRYVEE